MSTALEELAKRMTPLAPGKYLAGLSGGADSVAMTLMLMSRQEAWGLELEAVHVNHGLRGEASDRDEAYCKELCGRLKIPLRISRIDLGGRKDENSARNARMECFRQWTEKTGTKGVILAHHRDDAAETFLMRLLRGAGPDGLAGLAPESQLEGLHLYRPMLRIGREEIREALRISGIRWREDESNRDERFLRNAIRQTLIPEMERLAPGAARHIAAASEILGRERSWMTAEAEAFLKRYPESGWLRAEELNALPEAIRVRVLRLWWLRDGPKLEERQLNAEQTDALMRLAEEKSGRINLPGGFHAVRTGKNIHLAGRKPFRLPETAWKAPETAVGGIYILQQTASEGNPGDGRSAQEVPEHFFDGCIIRSRQNGDWIRPFGSGFRKKLQDYLVDRGVDEPWRDRVPLVCRGQEVIWAGGVGTGAVPPWGGTKNTVRMVWHGKMPWNEQGEEKEHGQDD